MNCEDSNEANNYIPRGSQEKEKLLLGGFLNHTYTFVVCDQSSGVAPE